MTARRLFAAARGVAGAALGTYLAMRLWAALGFALRALRLETSLMVLGPLFLCPAAYLGYGCFRGLRERRFAYAATWGCAFLALPLTVKPAAAVGWLGVCLLSALFVCLSRFLGREMFLRYADPTWYRDPRRIAARGGGGRSPNRCGPEVGTGLLVPDAFAVNEGGGGPVLYVRGTVLRWEPPLSRGRTFSTEGVAGVLIGPACNVLYSAQGESLARFRAGQKNGPLLARYLREQEIPFYHLSEVPQTGPLPSGGPPESPKPVTPLGEAVWEAVSEYAAELEKQENGAEEAIRHTDLSRHSSQDFTLELRRTRPIGAWIGAGMLLTIAVLPIGFPIAALMGERYIVPGLKIMLVLMLVLIAGPWVWAMVSGELFPPRLSVESGHIWLDKGFFPIREIPLADIGGLRYDRSDECYILYDKREKILAKFSTRDDFGSQFLNFLTDHEIRLCK